MTTRRARIALSGDPSAIAFARERVLIQVCGWGVPLNESDREAVRLVASELITNAVVHCGGFITVGLYYESDEGRLLLVVHDGNAQPPQRHHATPDDESGRGLALVDALAAETGWEPTARGKKVWAAFKVPVPAGESSHSALLRRRVQALAPRQHVHDRLRPLAMAVRL